MSEHTGPPPDSAAGPAAGPAAEPLVPGLVPATDAAPDGGWLGRTWRAGRRLYDERLPKVGPIPATEEVALDLRQHPVALVTPVVRTVAGLVAVIAWPHLWPILAFAATIAVWARRALHVGLKGCLVAAAVGAGLILAWGPGSPLYRLLLLVGLLSWAVLDALQWREDRLIVTTKRIYRVYGLLTQQAPSISLTGVAYINTGVNPLGRLLHYGVLHLDSAAQEDVPLSSIRYVPDVLQVHARILELRSKAMPKFPTTPP